MLSRFPVLARTCTVISLAACGTRGDFGTAQVERRVIADTTLVRTLAGSAWGDSIQLVDELSIGVLDGPPEYELGGIQDLAVDAQGGILAFDGQVPALRYYDSSGTYVRTLGRKGSGPGEYQDASLGLAVRRSDGRVVMRDPRNARLNVYAADGTPSESWLFASGLFTSRATVLDTADHMYLKIMTGRPERNKVWPIAVAHLDSHGRIIDTLVPPIMPHEPEIAGGTFGVSKVWALSPLGGFIIAVTDRYRLDHYRPDGTVLRMERDVPAIALFPEEKSEWVARDDWLWKWQGEFMTSERQPIPDMKPVFRDILVSEDGRVWVRRYVPAEKGEPRQGFAGPGRDPPPPMSWHEPVVYDVFESDGSFLGTLRLPARTNLMVMRGDHVWGVRAGENDESHIVRLRIERR